MDTKQYFQENQKLFLSLVNSEVGRHLFSIKDKEPIIKVSPNSIHQLMGFEKDQMIVKGKFYCGQPVVARMLIPHVFSRPLKVNQVFPFSLVLKQSEWAAKTMFPQVGLTTFYTGAGDGQCVHSPGGTTSWAVTIAATASSSANYTGTTATMGQAEDDGGNSWNCGRGFLPADTSSIPNNATLDSGSLNFVPSTVRNGDADTIYLEQTTQANTSQVVVEDYDQVGSVTNAGSGAMSGFSAATPASIALNATSLSWISLTSVTKIGLKLGRDISGTSPPEGPGANLLIIYTSENGSSQPYYSITYSLPTGFFAFM